MANHPAAPLALTDDERAALVKMSRSGTLPERVVTAATGLVLAGQGVANTQIAERLGVSAERVRRWRRRFEQTGLEGVGAVAAGRGRKPSLPAGTVPEIVRMTLTERPADGSTHWSTRSLARVVGVSAETVRRVWAAHGLKPWRVETFKLSHDPHFERKLVDVVGLYLNPPERAVVFSFDEKTQVQALDRTQPSLPMKRGRGQTMTHDYKRNGTTDLFAALDVASGKVITGFRRSHAGADVLAFFKRELTDRRLTRGSFMSLQHLTDAITLWVEHWNEDPKPFVWRAEAAQILTKVRRGRAALNRPVDSVADH